MKNKLPNDTRADMHWLVIITPLSLALVSAWLVFTRERET